MKNSLTRKGLAVASAFALAIAGLAAYTPANAETGVDPVDVNFEFTESTDLFDTFTYAGYEDGAIGVREGTKSVTFKAQIDPALANVKVKLLVEEGDEGGLTNDARVTVSGASGDVDEDGGYIEAIKTTDSNGEVSYTLNNSTGWDEDDLDLTLYYWENGEWNYGNDVFMEWQEAYQESFEVDDNYIGSVADTVSLTYTAYDQFGGPISKTETDGGQALSVSVFSGYEWNGTEDEPNNLFAPQTKALVSGKASFTVENVASLGNYNYAIAFLHTGTLASIYTSGDNFEDIYIDSYEYNGTYDDSYEFTQIWRNGATNKVDPDFDVYENKVTYAFEEDDDAEMEIYVSFLDGDGDESDSVYQDVTLTSSGLIFCEGAYDEEDCSENSITIETDSSGYAYVNVYAKIENLSGKPVQISSGGKSDTVELITYMNDEISEDGGANLSWNWKKVAGGLTNAAPASNTEYVVKVKARDIWGNILKGAHVWVNADNEEMYDPYEDSTVKIWGLDEDSDDNSGYVHTDDNGIGTFSVRATNFEYPNRKAFYWFTAELSSWEYDFEFDGTTSTSFEGYNELGVDELGETAWESLYGGEYEIGQGWTGLQAQAVAGAKKGVVRVGAYNAKGRTVKIYVGGTLVKTVTASKAKFVTKVKGVKAGDKRVTVWVGKKRLFSGSVTVK